MTPETDVTGVTNGINGNDVTNETNGTNGRKKTMKVTAINNGIVIDHISPGKGIIVLDILGLPDLEHGSVVSAVLNVPTRSGKRKDIIKIEEKNLEAHELDIISLIAPDATINVIKNTEVVEKYKVRLPETVKGIVRCVNPNCITNQQEPVEANFIVMSRAPVALRCTYCERTTVDIAGQIIR